MIVLASIVTWRTLLLRFTRRGLRARTSLSFAFVLLYLAALEALDERLFTALMATVGRIVTRFYKGARFPSGNC